MNVYSQIQSALDAYLTTHASFADLPKLQLENTRNVGQTGVPFTRATLLPARTTQATIGLNGRDAWAGLYQIDVFYPVDSGTTEINRIVDIIVDGFPRGTQLTSDPAIYTNPIHLQIQACSRDVGRRIDPFYCVPVTVQWSLVY